MIDDDKKTSPTRTISGWIIVWESNETNICELVQEKVATHYRREPVYREKIFPTLQEAMSRIQADGELLLKNGNVKKIWARIYPVLSPPTQIESHSSVPSVEFEKRTEK